MIAPTQLLARFKNAKTRERSELYKKHPLAIRWFHWINFPVLFLMIWSGLLIYWANRVFTINFLGIHIGPLFSDSIYAPHAPSWVPDFFVTKSTDDAGHVTRLLWSMDARLAEGMSWHFFFAWIFAINGALYVSYLVFSGAWKKLVPKPSALKESVFVVLHDLRLYKKPLPVRKYNAAQQITYTGVIFMGLGMLITGLAIYKPAQLEWLTSLIGGYTVARFLHFWITMAFLGFFVVHVGQVIKTGWNNFRAMVTGYELVTPDEKSVLEAE